MSCHSHRDAYPSKITTRRRLSLAAAAGSVGILVAAILTSTASTAQAADPAVGLGVAADFAVLAGSTVTNTGASVLSGDVGLSPGSSVTGFPPGHILGTKHVADAVAVQAKKDLTTAYDDAAGRTMKTNVTGKDLAGMTLTPGVYEASSAMALTGHLTLDAQGDPAAVFIFKAGSTLITAPNSSVTVINSGSSCHVFWQVGSSATFKTATRFVGTILAHTSATLGTSTRLEGRVLAMTGAVTLQSNVITAPHCATSGPSATATSTASPPPGGIGRPLPGTTKTPTGTATPRRDNTGPPSPSKSPTLPVIPKGHPHTGLGGSQGSSSAPLFVLAALTALGALLLGGLGLGRSEKMRT